MIKETQTFPVDNEGKPQVANEKPEKSKHLLVLLLLIFIFFVGAAMGGLYIYNYYPTPTEEGEGTEEVEETEEDAEFYPTTEEGEGTEEVEETEEGPEFLSTEDWRTYSYDVNSAAVIPDDDWLFFPLTRTTRTVSISFMYPNEWSSQEIDSPDIFDPRTSKKAMEFTPRVIILSKNMTCFQNKPQEWDGLMSSGSLISKEEISFSNLSGIRLIEERIPLGEERYYTHSYCLNNKDMAIILQFNNYSANGSDVNMVYETIMSTVSVEWNK